MSTCPHSFPKFVINIQIYRVVVSGYHFMRSCLGMQQNLIAFNSDRIYRIFLLLNNISMECVRINRNLNNYYSRT